MNNMGQRVEQIKYLANIIHQFAYPKRGKIDKVESIIDLLNSVGIEAYDSKMTQLSISGYVTMSPQSGRPMIVVNSDEPINRQRFTMAHELGHLLLHFNWVPNAPFSPISGSNVAYRHELEIYSPDQKIQEFEANMFAAELLMPSDKFKEMLLKTSNEKELANYFGVSISAVRVRKKTLSSVSYS